MVVRTISDEAPFNVELLQRLLAAPHVPMRPQRGRSTASNNTLASMTQQQSSAKPSANGANISSHTQRSHSPLENARSTLMPATLGRNPATLWQPQAVEEQNLRLAQRNVFEEAQNLQLTARTLLHSTAEPRATFRPSTNCSRQLPSSACGSQQRPPELQQVTGQNAKDLGDLDALFDDLDKELDLDSVLGSSFSARQGPPQPAMAGPVPADSSISRRHGRQFSLQQTPAGPTRHVDEMALGCKTSSQAWPNVNNGSIQSSALPVSTATPGQRQLSLGEIFGTPATTQKPSYQGSGKSSSLLEQPHQPAADQQLLKRKAALLSNESCKDSVQAPDGTEDEQENLDTNTGKHDDRRGKKGAKKVKLVAHKPAKKAAGTKQDLPPPETLIFSDSIVNVTSTMQLQTCLAAAEASMSVCLGLLLKDSQTGTRYFSTCRTLNKPQLQAIQRACGPAPKSASGKKGTDSTIEASKTPDSVGDSERECEEPASTAVCIASNPPQSGGLWQSQSTLAGDSGHMVGILLRLSHYDSQQHSPAYFASLESRDAPLELNRTAAFSFVEKLLALRTPLLCFDMQGMLRRLSSLGINVPPAHKLQMEDPKLLAWLHEPQLVQRDEKEIEAYTLHELARHFKVTSHAQEGPEPEGPLQQLDSDLQLAAALAAKVYSKLDRRLPALAVQREMQIAAMLAQMEHVGVGFDPEMLLSYGARLRARSAELEAQAAALVGRPFLLASASQLAQVLYTELKLPPPQQRGTKSSAKTHHPTDEMALRSLLDRHPLPGLVLEYRMRQNALTHWVNPDWVQKGATSLADGHGSGARVFCSWNQTATATGRLSSSSPNLQAVTKYAVVSEDDSALSQACPEISIRDAFKAKEGCVLLAADYSQVELRILAHLSGDPALLSLLRQDGDVFSLIAANWLRPNSCSVADVTKEERQQAKSTVYGIIYGQQAQGLARILGMEVRTAQGLIDSFLGRFPGVRAFLERTKQRALAEGFVTTLAGRSRPIKHMGSADRRLAAEAERKAVNSTIQGSSADITKAAMISWCKWREDNCAGNADPKSMHVPPRLVAQIHDELIFEVASGESVQAVAKGVKRLMEGAARLAVPLIVNMKFGERWGSLQHLHVT